MMSRGGRRMLFLVSLAVTTAAAAGTCNLGCIPCASLCDGGCATPVAVTHRAPACALGGAFNLIGTAYESTCATGVGGCSIDVPPIRFWQFDDFQNANSGCADPAMGPAIANASRDRGQAVSDGHWVLEQFDWVGPKVDGCIPTGGATPSRLVAELSFVDASREGTVAHRGRYLIASVAELAAGFDFDRIQGATGCNPADVVMADVPALTIPAPAWSRTNGYDDRYFDIIVDLPATPPIWFTEAGSSALPGLIAGYQVVYAAGAEPTTSASCAWLPAHDPANPRLALGVVPLATPRVTVSIPGNCALPRATPHWLALRLVYTDASINPKAPFDPTIASGPLLTSAVSAHAGPVFADTFEPPYAFAGKWLHESTPAVVPAGAPVVYTMVIGGAYLRSPLVELVDPIPPCLDDRDFDPATKPWQVRVSSFSTGNAWASYNRTNRMLNIVGVGNFRWDVEVEVRGLFAAADDPACCNTASAQWESRGCGVVTTSTDSVCVAIDSRIACSVAPRIVQRLYAVDDIFGNVTLSWDQATDAATIAYDAWKLTSEDPSRIPLMNKAEWPLSADLLPLCWNVARAAPSCFDWADPLDPALVFYQVRGVCADGSEGTAHP